MNNDKLKTITNLFEGSEIRSIWDNEKEEYYFSVIDEEYCTWGVKRLNMAETDKEIQGYNGGFFWERNTLNLQMKDQKKESRVSSRKIEQPRNLSNTLF